MAQRCELTGISVQSGNMISHSNRKTKRRFLPNLQSVSLPSEILGTDVHLRITVAALRSVDHNGGLDNYLLKTASAKLPPEAAKLKRALRKRQATKSA